MFHKCFKIEVWCVCVCVWYQVQVPSYFNKFCDIRKRITSQSHMQ